MRLSGPPATNVFEGKEFAALGAVSSARPSAPYTLNSNKPVLTTEQAGKQITRRDFRFHDRNVDQKIDLSFRISKGFTPQ